MYVCRNCKAVRGLRQYDYRPKHGDQLAELAVSIVTLLFLQPTI